MIRNLAGKLGALGTKASDAPALPASVMLERITRVSLSTKHGCVRLCDINGIKEESVWVLGNTDHGWDKTDCVFFDTETTGLSGGVGTVAFLVGAGWFEDNHFVIAQWLMTDYDVEADVLGKTHERLSRAHFWVTFNGRSFDVPLLRSRMLLQRTRLGDDEHVHIDLLHPARRVWRGRLESCSLQSLEREILGFHRPDDIPGAEIPARFFSYLKSRDLRSLEDVIRHNREDIVSLAALFILMAQAVESPEALDSHDAYGLGLLNEKSSRFEAAERCYRLSSTGRTLMISQIALAALYKRTARYADAARVLSDAIARHPHLLDARVKLAVIYERYLSDAQSALDVTESALLWCRMSRYADLSARESLERRFARLQRKQNASLKRF